MCLHLVDNFPLSRSGSCHTTCSCLLIVALITRTKPGRLRTTVPRHRTSQNLQRLKTHKKTRCVGLQHVASRGCLPMRISTITDLQVSRSASARRTGLRGSRTATCCEHLAACAVRRKSSSGTGPSKHGCSCASGGQAQTPRDSGQKNAVAWRSNHAERGRCRRCSLQHHLDTTCVLWSH